MKITTSQGYHGKRECDFLSDCERRYCWEDRLLWNDCETVKRGYQGDGDLEDGTETIYELGECPKCEARERQKKIFREVIAMYPGQTVCPSCWEGFVAKNPDDVAIHLIDTHGWDTDKATIWLRNEVEPKAFMKEP